MRRQICENYHPIPGPVNQSRPIAAAPLHGPRPAARSDRPAHTENRGPRGRRTPVRARRCAGNSSPLPSRFSSTTRPGTRERSISRRTSGPAPITGVRDSDHLMRIRAMIARARRALGLASRGDVIDRQSISGRDDGQRKNQSPAGARRRSPARRSRGAYGTPCGRADACRTYAARAGRQRAARHIAATCGRRLTLTAFHEDDGNRDIITANGGPGDLSEAEPFVAHDRRADSLLDASGST